MALAGLDGIRVLHSIQTRSDKVRNDFVERNRLLNEIRSELFLSGTWVRDSVLEPDPARADADRASLRRTRGTVTAATETYTRVMSAAEAAPFAELRTQLSGYWQLVDGVMEWDREQRRTAGYAFLRDEVYPRRTAMVATADRIAAINEHQLNARILQVTSLFSGLRLRVGVTMGVTLLLGGLLAMFTTRRILAFERRATAHLGEMEHARSALKDLSTRLVEAQESERRAISRELHDEVGQSLSALLVNLSNMAAEMPAAARTALAEPFASVRTLAESSLRAVRDMALLLRPSMLDDLGLVPALQWQGREVSKRAGIAVSVDAAGVPEELPDDYRTSVYRVVQEALHNCEQHAAASSIRVTLRGHAHALVLSVQDDGSGFDAEARQGMGMLGMQERIANLGGTFNVESAANTGTLIMVRLPLPA